MAPEVRSRRADLLSLPLETVPPRDGAYRSSRVDSSGRRRRRDAGLLFQHEGREEASVIGDRVELPHDDVVHAESDDGIGPGRVTGPRSKPQDDDQVSAQSPMEESGHVFWLVLLSYLELVFFAASVSHS